MECPICKNKIGFNCGTCIECGYNYLSNNFEFIEVSVKVLAQLIPQNICDSLVKEHEKYRSK